MSKNGGTKTNGEVPVVENEDKFSKLINQYEIDGNIAINALVFGASKDKKRKNKVVVFSSIQNIFDLNSTAKNYNSLKLKQAKLSKIVKLSESGKKFSRKVAEKYTENKKGKKKVLTFSEYKTKLLEKQAKQKEQKEQKGEERE